MVNMATVDELKAQGNAAISAHDYPKAVECYTKAIELAPDNHVLYSNRSAAYTSMGQYEKALADAEKTVTLQPSWPKGYSRKGTALIFLGDLQEAVAAFQQGLTIAPDDAALQKGMKDAIAAARDPLSQLKRAMASPDLIPKLALHPELRALLGDEQFMKDLGEIQANPETLGSKLDNPNILKVLKLAMGVEVRSGDEDSSKKEAPKAKTPEPAPSASASAPEAMDEDTEASEEAANKRQAVAEKELGNQAYKAKRFAEAMAHYERAAELDPGNMSLYSNMAAVYFEQGQYEQCREMCHKAVEVGHEHHADFTMVAKAYARIGNAYHKEGNLDEALKWLQKSLTEHRTKDVLDKVTRLEKELKEAREQAYVDPALAAEEKAKGNDLFKAGDFPGAVKAYSEAIRRNPHDAVLYSNRAAAYMKLMQFPTALTDCNKALELDATFVKGYTRKGNCLYGLKEYARAMEAFEKALDLDADNKDAKEGLQRTMYTMQMRNAQLSDEQRAEEAMKDPEVQEIMADPSMRIILQQMQEDPKAAQDHLRNPEVARRLQKLINAGIISVR